MNRNSAGAGYIPAPALFAFLIGCRFSRLLHTGHPRGQNFPPPPPWVTPPEDSWVLLPLLSLSFGLAVRETLLYRNRSLLSVICRLSFFR